MEINEQRLKDEFGLSEADLNKPADEINENIVDDEEATSQAESTETKKVSKHEEEARALGWVSQEEFIAQGKDAEDWKPANAFLEINHIHKTVDEKIKRIEKKYDDDLRKVNRFHELQLVDTIQRLTAARNNAVETGDVEAFNAIDAQLDKIKNAPIPNNKPREILEWEERNSWSNDPQNEKTILANALFAATQRINPNMSMTDRLKYVDDNLAIKFPKEKPTNTRREIPATTETKTKISTKTTYSMNDLTHAERDQYRKYGDMYDNEQHFIKVALEARKK